jgi:hypothetical protein
MLAILPVLAFAAAVLAAPGNPGAGADPALGITLGTPPLAPPAATTGLVAPNPTQVSIESIAYGGSGCPQGSVGSFISADRTTCVGPAV